MNFEVGETVVYPHHGAATIEEVEMRTFKGEEKTYLTLRVSEGDLTIKVPADNVDLVGVRDVVDQEGLDKVFGLLQAEHTEEPTNWSRRYKANVEKLASGSIHKLAEVVRDLWRRENDRGLSAGEKRMLSQARRILVSELRLARDLEEEPRSCWTTSSPTRPETRSLPQLNTASFERPEGGLTSSAHRRALIVVAAGSGTRLGHALPKAAVPLSRRSILEHALDAVTEPLGFGVVVIVVPSDASGFERLPDLRGELAARIGADVRLTAGGASRAASVAEGCTKSRSTHDLRGGIRSAPPCSSTTLRALSPPPMCTAASRTPSKQEQLLRCRVSCRRHHQTDPFLRWAGRGVRGGDAAARQAARRPDSAGLLPRGAAADPQGPGRPG